MMLIGSSGDNNNHDAAAGDDADDETHQQLLKKRIYRPAVSLDDAPNDEGISSKTTKLTELERVVLLDCLATNFLFSHVCSKEELELFVLSSPFDLTKSL